jgi:hypothetical protein
VDDLVVVLDGERHLHIQYFDKPASGFKTLVCSLQAFCHFCGKVLEALHLLLGEGLCLQVGVEVHPLTHDCRCPNYRRCLAWARHANGSLVL